MRCRKDAVDATRKLDTFTNEFVCFVKVSADSGHSGWVLT